MPLQQHPAPLGVMAVLLVYMSTPRLWEGL